MQERLHKILAHAGYGSRRACEEIIAAGRVTVNGRVVSVGDKAEFGSDDIRIDGRRVKAERKVYFLLNKPPGYITTSADPQGRRKVTDLLASVRERVYPVGRLDGDSRGLIILTNDGDLAARLTHPRYEVPKTYEAEVDGRVEADDLRKLSAGMWLSDGKTAGTQVRVVRRGTARSLIAITLREGRNRQVRRMLARLNHKVRKLTRTRIGPLSLHGLGPGRFRELTSEEVRSLFKATERRPSPKTSGKKGARSAKRQAGSAPKGKQSARKQPAKRAPKDRKLYDFTA